MTYQQYRAVRRLVHSCCNYQDGNCLHALGVMASPEDFSVSR